MTDIDYNQHTWLPEFIPPWECKIPELPFDGVRADYKNGLWAYAVGYPANIHPKFGEGGKVFKKRSPALTPRLIKAVSDV